jgi:ribonucleoside-diphosphate reductase beta chain
MDSTQSRGLDSILCNLTTSPEWEAVFRTQGYFEQIHSISYSHIVREMYPDATAVFDRIGEVSEIHHRVDKEVAAYDELASDVFDAYDDDKKREKILELCVRVYALEGVKFYISFLVTYIINHSYNSKIQGFTRIIKLINFDEDFHVSVFGGLLNILRKEEMEGFTDLIASPKYAEMVKDIFSEVRQGELEWGKFLMSFGNIPSLTPKVLENFMDYYTNDRMSKLKIGVSKSIATDTEKWFETYKNIDLDNVAGQEGEGLAYNVGILKNDVAEGRFKI